MEQDNNKEKAPQNRMCQKELRAFIVQLRNKRFQSVFDFRQECEMKWKISSDKNWFFIEDKNEIFKHKLLQNNGSQLMHEPVVEEENAID